MGESLTPTPEETFRTVNVDPASFPCLTAITKPSKAWSRVFPFPESSAIHAQCLQIEYPSSLDQRLIQECLVTPGVLIAVLVAIMPCNLTQLS